MKRNVLVLLSVFIIAMFLVGCAETVEETDTEDVPVVEDNAGSASEPIEVSAAELAELTTKCDQESKYSDERNNCYVDFIVEKNNFDLCKTLGSEHISEFNCYYNVASTTSNSNLCDNLDDDYTVQKCKAVAERNVDGCAGLDGMDVDLCVEDIAKLNLDPELCKTITGQRMEMCVLEIAKAKNDVSICDHLPAEGAIAVSQEKCQGMVE